MNTTIPLIIYATYVPIVFVIYLVQVIIVIMNKKKQQFRSSYFTLFIIESLTVSVSIHSIEKSSVFAGSLNYIDHNIHAQVHNVPRSKLLLCKFSVERIYQWPTFVRLLLMK